MKIINYAYNILRLSKMKASGKYKGTVLQGIPVSTEIRSITGIINFADRLSCRKNCYLSASTGELNIGRNCFFNDNVMIVSKSKICIGNDVIIGPNVVIVDHDHDYESDERQTSFKSAPIIIGDNVWIGANVVITKGTTIGSNSVIGAGTVLKGVYTDNLLIYQEKQTKTRTIERKTPDESEKHIEVTR